MIGHLWQVTLLGKEGKKGDAQRYAAEVADDLAFQTPRESGDEGTETDPLQESDQQDGDEEEEVPFQGHRQRPLAWKN